MDDWTSIVAVEKMGISRCKYDHGVKNCDCPHDNKTLEMQDSHPKHDLPTVRLLNGTKISWKDLEKQGAFKDT